MIMRKEEYLQRLEMLLSDVPAEDRKEAIQFYRDYLEDAGDQVEEVLQSLGTPEQLAESILNDLENNGGTATIRNEIEVREVAGERTDKDTYKTYKRERKAYKRGKLTFGQWVVFIILLLCAAPVIVPVCGGLLSVLIGLAVAVLAVIFGVGAAGVALVIAAIVVIVVALAKMVLSPLSSLVMVGGGLLMVGIGLIGMAAAIWVICKLVPAIFVGTINILHRLLHGK